MNKKELINSPDYINHGYLKIWSCVENLKEIKEHYDTPNALILLKGKEIKTNFKHAKVLFYENR